MKLATFANLSPGRLNQARWLTRANRVLRYYMSAEFPSPNLLRLVLSIINIYVSFWFREISVSYGLHHLFWMIIDLDSLNDPDIKAKAIESLKNNPYFAHPECTLLAGLADEDILNHVQAAEDIETARENKNK